MSAGRLRIIVGAIAVTALVGCGGDDVSDEERDQAVTAAQEAYDEARSSGLELDVGPCIAETLPGLDPREDVDDDPANQCRRYREGDASHFVELTPEGELIRAE
jgi:hypothetical protein